MIYRVFGDSKGDFVDQDAEVIMFQTLADKGVGVNVLGLNEAKKYRLEEFLEGETLGVKDLQNRVIRRKICKEIAAMHKIKIVELDQCSVIERIIDNPEFIIKKVLAKMELPIFTPREQK